MKIYNVQHVTMPGWNKNGVRFKDKRSPIYLCECGNSYPKHQTPFEEMNGIERLACGWCQPYRWDVAKAENVYDDSENSW